MTNFTGDEEYQRKVKNLDSVTLLDSDESSEDVENNVTDDIDFQNAVRLMDTKEKVVCLAIRMGYQKNEIAFMMNVHPSTVTRTYDDLLIKLKIWTRTQ